MSSVVPELHPPLLDRAIYAVNQLRTPRQTGFMLFDLNVSSLLNAPGCSTGPTRKVMSFQREHLDSKLGSATFSVHQNMDQTDMIM